MSWQPSAMDLARHLRAQPDPSEVYQRVLFGNLTVGVTPTRMSATRMPICGLLIMAALENTGQVAVGNSQDVGTATGVQLDAGRSITFELENEGHLRELIELIRGIFLSVNDLLPSGGTWGVEMPQFQPIRPRVVMDVSNFWVVGNAAGQSVRFVCSLHPTVSS